MNLQYEEIVFIITIIKVIRWFFYTRFKFKNNFCILLKETSFGEKKDLMWILTNDPRALTATQESEKLNWLLKRRPHICISTVPSKNNKTEFIKLLISEIIFRLLRFSVFKIHVQFFSSAKKYINYDYESDDLQNFAVHMYDDTIPYEIISLIWSFTIRYHTIPLKSHAIPKTYKLYLWNLDI